jgi:hypothetical protein
MSEETNPLPILRIEEPISIKLMCVVEEPAPFGVHWEVRLI